MIVELRDEDMRQEAGAHHTAPDRPRRGGWLNDLLAGPAGLLETGSLDHLQLGGDEVEDLGHVLANQAKGAAAIGTPISGIKHNAFARRVIGDTRLTAPALRGAFELRFRLYIGVVRGDWRACHH